MAIERINPAEIHQPGGYTHVVHTSGARTAYISGQVALDLEGNVVGPGDLEAHAEQAFANLQAHSPRSMPTSPTSPSSPFTSSTTAQRPDRHSKPRGGAFPAATVAHPRAR